MAGMTFEDSNSDVFYEDDPVRAPSRDFYSPLSNYSTYSQEVKYIFDPNLSVNNSDGNHSTLTDTCDEDYSQIQFSTKKTSLKRQVSQTSQYSTRSTHSLAPAPPPPPPPRTSSSSSQLSECSHRSYPVGYPSSKYLAPHYYPAHQVRRKTWSPEGLRMGFIGSYHKKHEQRNKSYSNEQLDYDADADDSGGAHLYDELSPAPPKIAPISGMLTRSPGRGIIRPIAFKPVVANQKFLSPPRQYGDRKYSQNHDDGYGSQDCALTNQNAANMSHGSGSVHMDSDRSTSFSSDYNRHSDRPDSLPSSNMSRLSSNHTEGYVQTPSPSDSGVGELEAILKEKDAEINLLREVMDKNERAIFQVHEEKKSTWMQDFRDLKEEYDRRLKIQQQKSYKQEQVLSLQIYKLQQEKKAIKDELDKLVVDKDDLVQKCERNSQEAQRLQLQLDDANFQCQRQTGSVSELQTQIDSLHDKLASKSEEVMRLRSILENRDIELEEKEREINYKFRAIVSKTEEVKALRASMERLNSSGSGFEPEIPLCQCEKEIQTEFLRGKSPEQQTLKLSKVSDKDQEIEALREEVEKLKQMDDLRRVEFEKEKEQWLEEKNKVIMYQKQLQLNYVQMFRKNKTLEAEVEQLTLELESRDLKLEALNGGEESVC